jgi:hypothetical protein
MASLNKLFLLDPDIVFLSPLRAAGYTLVLCREW